MDVGTYIKQEGSFLKEDINNEFKEFSFTTVNPKGSLIFTDEDIKDFTNGNYENLDDKTKFTIEIYLYKYIKKYFTTFGNTINIENDTGYLYIGIADDGEITGIPYYDTFENMKKHINDNVFQNILNVLKIQFSEEAKYYFDKIKEHIKIELINLSSNTIYLDDNVDEIIEDYKKNIIEFKKTVKKYRKGRREWVELVDYNRRAINVMINERDVRNKLKDYVNSYTKEKYLTFFDTVTKPMLFGIDDFREIQGFVKKHRYFVENYEEIRKDMLVFLDSDEELYYETPEIVVKKYCPNDIIFWITQFRDRNIDKLMLVKPKKKLYVEPENPYFTIKKNYSSIIKRMMKKRKMFYLKISFPSRDILNFLPEDLYYFKNGMVKCPSRKECADGSPCCI